MNERCLIQRIAPFFVILLVLLGAYGSGLTSAFGVIDDYLFIRHTLEGTFPRGLIVAGRPLNNLAYNIVYKWIGHIDNLVYLRGVTLFGTWLFASVLYAIVVQIWKGQLLALIAVCGVILLPSFQVYAAWAQHFTTPIAALLGVVGAWLMTPLSVNWVRIRFVRILLSAGIFFAALAIYQPIAMFYVLVLGLSISTNPELWKKTQIIDAVIAASLGLILGFLAYSIGSDLYPQYRVSRPRYNVTDDVAGKMRWFVQAPLANALSIFQVPGVRWVSVSVAFVIAAAGLFAFTRSDRRPVFVIGVLSIVCVAVYAPNLVSAENVAYYRGLGALGAVVLGCFVVSCKFLFTFFDSKINKRHGQRGYFALVTRGHLFLVLLMGVGMYYAKDRFDTIVDVEVRDYQFTQRFVRENLDAIRKSQNVIIKMRLTDPEIGQMYEFRTPTSVSYPHLEALVVMTLRQEGVYKIGSVSSFGSLEQPETGIVIDYNEADRK